MKEKNKPRLPGAAPTSSQYIPRTTRTPTTQDKPPEELDDIENEFPDIELFPKPDNGFDAYVQRVPYERAAQVARRLNHILRLNPDEKFGALRFWYNHQANQARYAVTNGTTSINKALLEDLVEGKDPLQSLSLVTVKGASRLSRETAIANLIIGMGGGRLNFLRTGTYNRFFTWGPESDVQPGDVTKCLGDRGFTGSWAESYRHSQPTHYYR